MGERLLFVSGNAGKAAEVEVILGGPVDRLELDLPEIQALEVEEVVRQKALAAFERVGRPVVVEDTGLYVAALGGLPGALVRWFLAAVGPAGICAMIPAGAERAARAKTAVAWCDGERVEVFAGETGGTIAAAPRGENGFGWDPIFCPEGEERTFAEMGMEAKMVHSMRRRALERMRVGMGEGD